MDLVLATAAEAAGDPDFPPQAHRILATLVANGAALGWVDPPGLDEAAGLLTEVLTAARAQDAALRCAYLGTSLAGLGYWTRYQRPTHRPHADLQKIAVAPDAQGCGVGRALVGALIADARAARIEVLTLDCRADNANALHLYQESGFTEYGRLKRFVAFGDRRYDKVLLSLDLRGTGPA
jgi:ribosomal protein S18 acetylase RimI-like enzyme